MVIYKGKIIDDELYVSSFAPIDSRMYTLLHKDSALVIDPCVDGEMLDLLKKRHVRKITIIPTHEHYDHISGINQLRECFECNVIANRACAENMGNPIKNFSAMFDVLFFDDEEKLAIVREQNIESYSCYADEVFDGDYKFKWNDHQVDIYSSPGHSQGSVCIVLDKTNVFTGDSLINGEKVITRLPGGSKTEYINITKPLLDKLCQGTKIYPGHGDWVKTVKEYFDEYIVSDIGQHS